MLAKVLKKKSQDPIEVQTTYLKILCALSGVEMSRMEIIVLSHLIVFGELSTEVRNKIAETYNTNNQVINNTLTRLRKSKFIIDNKPSGILAEKLQAKNLLSIKLGAFE